MAMAALARQAACASISPFHKLLKHLDNFQILRRVYSQNINAFELCAGIFCGGANGKCIQLHGSLMELRYMACGSLELLHHLFSDLCHGQYPICLRCQDYITKQITEETQTDKTWTDET
jgi:NAD-dependent SIR2 family protein deacetylase